mmetsp:Transcript_27393/g.85202  ORF Transcript_27393/g.85202 Transcript_27393/m.85202 type:complete len:133 (+) Transcript_27393:158-556(+)
MAPQTPHLVARFAQENVPKACLWSPDGTCLLTATEDAALRLFELPGAMLAGAATPSQTPWTETFQSKEAECVYDYCWFPHMHSDAPATCVFASRAPERNTPPPRNIHVAAAASTRPRAPRNIHSQPRRSRED